MIKTLLILVTPLLLLSCSNEVEEIKDPATGLLIEKYEYYLDDNGQKVKDGTNSKWDKKGVLQSVVNYKDGKKDGESISYKPGNLIFVYNYKDDKLDGESILKDEKNTILARYNYLNGLRDGKFQYMHFDSEEKLECEGQYLLDEQVGIWKYYDLKGKLLAQFEFKNGIPFELVGKWILNDDPNTYYVFKEDGTYSLWEFYNQYSRVISESAKGKYKLENGFILEMIIDRGLEDVYFNIQSFDKKQLVININDTVWKLTKVKS